MGMRLGGPQSWSGHFGERNNLLPCQVQTPEHATYRCTDCAIQALGRGKETLQTFIIKVKKAKSC